VRADSLASDTHSLSPVPLDTPAPSRAPEAAAIPTASPAPTPPHSAAPQATALAAVSPAIAQEAAGGMTAGSGFALGALAGAALAAAVAAVLGARLKKRAHAGSHARGAGALPEGLEIGNARNIGRRGNQEDAFAISDLNDARLVCGSGVLAVVADGMGGLADGELVSGAAAGAMMREYPLLPEGWMPQQKLLYLVGRANDAANEITGGVAGRGGATLAAALLRGGRLWFASVGDSRICLARGGALMTLTRPHAYETELDRRAACGQITFEASIADGQRGALTSYVGMGALAAVDYSPRGVQLLKGDWVLLMTDGVFNALGDEEIAEQLYGDAQAATERIECRVIAKGLPQQDNLTVVALRIC